MPQEKRITSASYFVTFMGDIETLLDYSALYINLIERFKKEHDKDDLLKKGDNALTPEDKQNLTSTIQALKTLVFKIYIRFNALAYRVDEFKKSKDEIKQLYEKIIKSKDPMPLEDDIEQFVIKIHEIFIYATTSELANEAENIVRGLAQ